MLCPPHMNPNLEVWSMRRFSPYNTGFVSLLALSLTVGCGGNADVQQSPDTKSTSQRTKIDKDGNTIFGQEATPSTAKNERVAPSTSSEPSKELTPSEVPQTEAGEIAPNPTEIDNDMAGVADAAMPANEDNTAQNNAITPEQDTISTPPKPTVTDAQKEERARRAEEAEARAKAEADRKTAEAKRRKIQQAEAARIAKANRRAAAQKKKADEKLKKADAQAKLDKEAAEQLAMQQAEQEKKRQEEEAEAARLRAEAKAAADAIRRAEAEAAAKLEKERQARELARIGTGLNSQCPYVTLETTAQEGKLSTDEMNCLESSMDKAGTGVDKANVSMVLLTNARAKGDVEQWEQRMEHHLTQIERENPALAYRYALHLFEKGPGHSQQTFRWTGIALQSRSAWAGDSYTDRVHAIYKLRAAAAQSLWKQSIEALASFPGPENENRVRTQRLLARNVAKEWYEFAATHEQDSLVAKQLCQIASLEPDFCDIRETSDAE